MSDYTSFMTLNQPCDRAVSYVIEKLSQSHLSVMRTFDLQMARHAQTVCPCPHHGTDLCTCQMVVLLVYLGKCTPVTLIAHGSDEQTWFSIVDTPQQRADPRVEAIIHQVVSTPLQ